MRNLSEEIIEVGGKEYKLFLNRQGVVAFERDSREFQEEVQEKQKVVDNLEERINEKVVKSDNDNPFEGLDDVDNIDTNIELTEKIELSLYRILLYKYHPMTRTQVKEWFNQAEKEYGLTQLAELGKQMIDDINKDNVTDEQNLKKLKALRQAKK